MLQSPREEAPEIGVQRVDFEFQEYIFGGILITGLSFLKFWIDFLQREEISNGKLENLRSRMVTPAAFTSAKRSISQYIIFYVYRIDFSPNSYGWDWGNALRVAYPETTPYFSPQVLYS